MKKAILLIFFLTFISVPVLAVDISSCGTLSSNTYYRLTQDINYTGSDPFSGNYRCFVAPIGITNYILDLNGHTVRINNGDFIYASEGGYFKIINGKIILNHSLVFFIPSTGHMHHVILENVEIQSITDSYFLSKYYSFGINYPFEDIYAYNISLIGINSTLYLRYYATDWNGEIKDVFFSRVRLRNVYGSNIKGRICYDEMVNSTIISPLESYNCSGFTTIYKLPEFYISIPKSSFTVFGDSYNHIIEVENSTCVRLYRYAKDFSAYFETREVCGEWNLTDVTPFDVKYSYGRVWISGTRSYNTGLIGICWFNESNYAHASCTEKSVGTFLSYSSLTFFNDTVTLTGVNSSNYVFIWRLTPTWSVIKEGTLPLPSSFVQVLAKPYTFWNGTHYNLIGVFNNNIGGYSGYYYVYRVEFDNNLNYLNWYCLECTRQIQKILFQDTDFGYTVMYMVDFDKHLIGTGYYHDFRERFIPSEVMPSFDPVETTNFADPNTLALSVYAGSLKYSETETLPPTGEVTLTPENFTGILYYSGALSYTYTLTNNVGTTINFVVNTSQPSWSEIKNSYISGGTITSVTSDKLEGTLNAGGVLSFTVEWQGPNVPEYLIGSNVTVYVYAYWNGNREESVGTFEIRGPVPTTCGNGICEAGESYINCPLDCYGNETYVCGNGICEAGESYDNCPTDCPLSYYAPPTLPPVNITYPELEYLPFINTTEWVEAGYSWALPFFSKIFLFTFFGLLVAGGIEYLSKSHGRAFIFTMLMWLVIGCFVQIYPYWILLVLIIIGGFLLFYKVYA